MPSWVNAGFEDYAGRLTREYKLELLEIPLGLRTGADVSPAVQKEGERMLAAAGDKNYLVALQVTGKPLSTEELAKFLRARSLEGRAVAFCIGGPEGIAPAVNERADFRWSLSALTLPHGLARIVVAEALYRAVSVIKGHPYHRG